MSAETQAGFLPPLRFIDTHHHFQDISRFSYPWLMDRSRPLPLEGDLEPIRRNYLPADHAADLAQAVLLKSVHIENGWDRTDPVGETRWIQSLVPDAPHLAAIVAYADLAAPDVAQVQEAHREASPLFRGIRQSLNWHEEARLRFCASPRLMDDPAWRRGFGLLHARGLSFDLQIYWPQMEQAARLATAFPETTIILDHFGMPIDRSARGLTAWRHAMLGLARCPNVRVKLSGFGLGAPGWRLADLQPILNFTIQTFGPQRCMVGSNLPVDRLFGSFSDFLAALNAILSLLSKQESQAICSGTPERVYRI